MSFIVAFNCNLTCMCLIFCSSFLSRYYSILINWELQQLQDDNYNNNNDLMSLICSIITKIKREFLIAIFCSSNSCSWVTARARVYSYFWESRATNNKKIEAIIKGIKIEKKIYNKKLKNIPLIIFKNFEFFLYIDLCRKW